MTAIETLIDILTLEPIEVNLFRGQTPEDERRHNRIYGGQVIAQALMGGLAIITSDRAFDPYPVRVIW